MAGKEKDSAEKSREFEGLILDLKKRRLGLSPDELSNYGFLMYGYYDCLDIYHTKSWFEFSPIGMEYADYDDESKSDPEVTKHGSFFDHHPIKLIFPSKTCQEEMEQTGFSFEPWRRESQWKSNENKQQYPLISILQFNVTNDFLAEYKTPQNCLRQVAHGIVHVAKHIAKFKTEDNKFDRKRFRDLNCGLFQSIGSQDYVLLCRTHSWEDVFKVADALHAWKFKVQDENRKTDKIETAAISNIYLTPGISTAFCQESKMNINDANIEAVIRLTLQSGKSLKDLSMAFLEQFPQDKDKEGIKFHVLHGRYDGAITSLLPIYRTLNWFKPGQMLSPDSELFKNFLVDTNASIRIRLPHYEQFADNSLCPDDSLCVNRSVASSIGEGGSRNQNRFFDRINNLETWVKGDFETDFLCKHKLHVRQSRALHELLVLLSNLSNNPHSNDICVILLDAFDSLRQNITYLIAKVNEAEASQAEEYLQYIEDGIRDFRDYVGDYLISLAQAERLFIEGLKLSHQSIASATKLLFAYNQVIRSLTQLSSRGSDYSYSFVVVSGGCDTTGAHNLFDYDPLPDEDNKLTENRLIVIQLSEMSVFNIQGTLFRIVHEAWHYCGDRLRGERNEAWVDSLSRSISKTLSVCFFGSGPLIEKVLKKTKDKSLKKKVQQLFNRQQRKFFNQLNNELKCYLKDQGFCTHDEIYGMVYRDDIYAAILGWLQPPVNERYGESEGEAIIRSFLYQNQAELHKKVAEEIKKVNEKSKNSIQTVSHQNLELYYKVFQILQKQDQAMPYKISSFIRSCLTMLCGNFVCESDIDECLGSMQMGEKLRESTKELCLNYDIGFHCNLMYEVYSEAFSDYMACYTLQTTAAEYILDMVYEDWDIEVSLPVQRLSILRIGSVMEAMSGQGKEEWPAEREVLLTLLQEKYEQLRDNCGWLKNRINIVQLRGRVDTLLKEYKYFQKLGISEPLVQYLKKCGDTLDQQVCVFPTREEQLRHIRTTYEAAGKLTQRKTHDQVVEGLNTFLQYWIDLNNQADNAKMSEAKEE